MKDGILKLVGLYNLQKVFTPAKSATVTYIQRPKLENDLGRYLSIPGMQLVLYGYTQSGKTTLIRKTLKEKKLKYIETSCEGKTTLEDLILQAYDKLSVYFKNDYSFTKEKSREFTGTAYDLSGKLASSDSQTTNFTRVAFQTTSQKLATLLGQKEFIWIIDDFHKVNDEEKKKIADILKIFVDSADEFPKTKIICIGAVGTAHELVKLETDLQNRVAEILVPLLTNEEILQIIRKGFKLMKISTPKGSNIEEKISHYSNNLATVAHQLCYNICYDKGVFTVPIFSSYLVDDSDFRKAVDAFIREHSATLQAQYDKICLLTNGEELMKTLVNNSHEFASIESLKGFSKSLKNLAKGELEILVDKVTKPEYEETLRYDQDFDRIYFSSPFFKAYIKMKIEADNADHSFKSKNFDLSLIHSDLLSDEFYNRYYGILDDVIFKRQTIIRKQIEELSKRIDKKN